MLHVAETSSKRTKPNYMYFFIVLAPVLAYSHKAIHSVFLYNAMQQ